MKRGRRPDHPQRGPWPVRCGICDEDIAYHSARGLCAECRRWRHRDCLLGRVCCECITRRPREVFAAANDILEMRLGPGIRHPDRDAAAMLLWSIFSGRRDESDAARSLGLDPGFTAEVAGRFRDSGVWTKDATVIDLPECPDVPEEFVWLISIVLSSMVGSGRLRREPLEDPGVGGAYAYHAVETR